MKRPKMETTLESTLEKMSRILNMNPSSVLRNDGVTYTYYVNNTSMTISSFKRDDSPDLFLVWQIQGSSADDIESLEDFLSCCLSTDENQIQRKSHFCDF